MDKTDEITFQGCLNDLYQLGVIQGEHNINWTDEYNLLEYSKTYYEKTKAIADKYNINYNTCIEDYRENDDVEENWLWDRMAFNMNEIIRQHLLIVIKNKELNK